MFVWLLCCVVVLWFGVIWWCFRFYGICCGLGMVAVLCQVLILGVWYNIVIPVFGCFLMVLLVGFGVCGCGVSSCGLVGLGGCWLLRFACLWVLCGFCLARIAWVVCNIVVWGFGMFVVVWWVLSGWRALGWLC